MSKRKDQAGVHVWCVKCGERLAIHDGYDTCAKCEAKKAKETKPSRRSDQK